MKRIALFIVFLVAFSGAHAKVNSEASAIASYLKLTAQQEQAVAKLYDTESKKRAEAREAKAASNKELKKNRELREKAAAEVKDRPKPKSAEGPKKAKPSVDASERFLKIAYGKSKAIPAIDAGLKSILTEAQYSDWSKLGN